MPISNSTIRTALSAALVSSLLAGGGAFAFDPEKTFKPDDEPRTILRYGFRALKQGKMTEAIGAFRFGAKKNDLASQWKLARMLQRGHDGLPKDDLAAYRLFTKIARRFEERPPRMQDRPYVSYAVVQLGKYALTGIDGTTVSANPQRAESHFYRSAALYKDREAQFQLGKLYRSGDLGAKQFRSAVRWFSLAARKGHREAQAQLGEMLFFGEGVAPNQVRGLVLISRAGAGNARKGLRKIRTIRKNVWAKATAAQRDAADEIMKRFRVNNSNDNQQPSGNYALQKQSAGALSRRVNDND